MRRSHNNPSTPTKGQHSRRSFTAVSPAAKELINRALYKSPRRTTKYEPIVLSEVESDDSTLSEAALRTALGRNSWQKNLRSSDFHPPLDQNDPNDDSDVEIAKRKAKSNKSSKSSSGEVLLPPMSPQQQNKALQEQEENEKPETPVKTRPRTRRLMNQDKDENAQADQETFDRTLQDINNTQMMSNDKVIPSRDSLLAFKKTGPVHHSDSEDSEPIVKKRLKRKKSSRKTENEINISFLNNDSQESDVIPDEISEVDTTPDLIRKKPKKSTKGAEPSMHFDFKFDQTRATRCSSDESSGSDVVIKPRRMTKPKKSTPESFKISLPCELKDKDESNLESDGDEDEDSDAGLKRQRLRKSKRKTVDNMDVMLNMSPDKEASTEMPDSEHDDSQNESTTRPRKTKNKKRTVSTEADFELPQMTPERNVPSRKSKSTKEDSPVNLREANMSLRNADSSKTLQLSLHKQDSLLVATQYLDDESPGKTRASRRFSSRNVDANMTPVEKPNWDDFIEERNQKKSSLNTSLAARSSSSNNENLKAMTSTRQKQSLSKTVSKLSPVVRASLLSPAKQNSIHENQTDSEDDSSDSALKLRRKQVKPKSNKKSDANIVIPPYFSPKSKENVDSEDERRKKVTIRMSSKGGKGIDLPSHSSPAKNTRNSTRNQLEDKSSSEEEEENDNDLRRKKKEAKKSTKSSSGNIILPRLSSPAKDARNKSEDELSSEEEEDNDKDLRRKRKEAKKSTNSTSGFINLPIYTSPAKNTRNSTRNKSENIKSSEEEQEDSDSNVERKTKQAKKSTSSSLGNIILPRLSSPAKNARNSTRNQPEDKSSPEEEEDNDNDLRRKTKQAKKSTKSSSGDFMLPPYSSPAKNARSLTRNQPVDKSSSEDEEDNDNDLRRKRNQSKKSTNSSSGVLNLPLYSSPAKNTRNSVTSQSEKEFSNVQEAVSLQQETTHTNKSTVSGAELSSNHVRQNVEVHCSDDPLSDDADSEDSVIIPSRKKPARKSSASVELKLPPYVSPEKPSSSGIDVEVQNSDSKQEHLSKSSRKSKRTSKYTSENALITDNSSQNTGSGMDLVSESDDEQTKTGSREAKRSKRIVDNEDNENYLLQVANASTEFLRRPEEQLANSKQTTGTTKKSRNERSITEQPLLKTSLPPSSVQSNKEMLEDSTTGVSANKRSLRGVEDMEISVGDGLLTRSPQSFDKSRQKPDNTFEKPAITSSVFPPNNAQMTLTTDQTAQKTGVRKSKQLLELEEILNFSKPPVVPNIRTIDSAEDFDRNDLQKKLNVSKTAQTVDENLEITDDSLPNLKRKLFQTSENSTASSLDLAYISATNQNDEAPSEKISTTTKIFEQEQNLTSNNQKDVLSSKGGLTRMQENFSDGKTQKGGTTSKEVVPKLPSKEVFNRFSSIPSQAALHSQESSGPDSQKTHISESSEVPSPDSLRIQLSDSEDWAEYRPDELPDRSKTTRKSTLKQRDGKSLSLNKSRAMSGATKRAWSMVKEAQNNIREKRQTADVDSTNSNAPRLELPDSTIDKNGVLDFEEDSSADSSGFSSIFPNDKKAMDQPLSVKKLTPATTATEENIDEEPQESSQHQNEDKTEDFRSSKPSDDESDSMSEPDTPEDFKRRRNVKRTYSPDNSIVSNLKLSFANEVSTEVAKSSNQSVEQFKLPSKESSVLPSRTSKAKSLRITKSYSKVPEDFTTESEAISLLHDVDDYLTRQSIAQRNSAAEDMDSGLAARKEVSQSLKRTKSGESVLPANLQDKLPHNKTSKSVAPDKIVSEKKRVSSNTTILSVQKPTRDSVKRNLHNNFDESDSESLAPSSTVINDAHNSFSRDNMTTPTNDLTMTLKEGTDALLHIENTENDEDAGEEVVRAFTAEDFHQAIQAQKELLMSSDRNNANSLFKQPHSRDKIFTLAELGKAMMNVRSPSMIANSSTLLHGNQTKLFSIRDFERALIKLKKKSNFVQSNSQDIVAEDSNAAPAKEPEYVDQRKNISIAEQLASNKEKCQELLEDDTELETDPLHNIEDLSQKSADNDKSVEDRTVEDFSVVDKEDESQLVDKSTEPESSQDNDEPSQPNSSESSDENLDDEDQNKGDENDEEEEESQHEASHPIDKTMEDTYKSMLEIQDGEQVFGRHDQRRSTSASKKLSNSAKDGNNLMTKYYPIIDKTSTLGQQSARRSLMKDLSPQPRLDELDESGVTPFSGNKKDILSHWKNLLAVTQKQVKKKEAMEAEQELKRIIKLKAEQKAKAKELKAQNAKRAAKFRPPQTKYKTVDIVKELKQTWVNKRLIEKLEPHFLNEVPKVMNDFLRTLVANVVEVIKSENKKKLPENTIKTIIRNIVEAGICKTENEFYRFIHEYMPETFVRVGFMNVGYKKYYDFENDWSD